MSELERGGLTSLVSELERGGLASLVSELERGSLASLVLEPERGAHTSLVSELECLTSLVSKLEQVPSHTESSTGTSDTHTVPLASVMVSSCSGKRTSAQSVAERRTKLSNHNRDNLYTTVVRRNAVTQNVVHLFSRFSELNQCLISNILTEMR